MCGSELAARDENNVLLKAKKKTFHTIIILIFASLPKKKTEQEQ